MSKKTQELLAHAREWVEKNKASDVDTAEVSTALGAAERTVRDVEQLKGKLATAREEKRVAVRVLEETLKSVKHARRARKAREKADKPEKKPLKSPKKSAKAAGKPNAKSAQPTVSSKAAPAASTKK